MTTSRQTVTPLEAAWDYVSTVIDLSLPFDCVKALFGEQDRSFFEQYGNWTEDDFSGESMSFLHSFAGVYSLLTRCEEWQRTGQRDVHGRFPGKASQAFREGLLAHPLVDEYAEKLRESLRERGQVVSEPERVFRVRLTHDVDLLNKYGGPVRAVVAPFLALRPFSSIPEYFRVASGRQREPFDTFDWMMAQDNALKEALGEDRVDIIYYFLAGGNTRFDRTYDVSSREVKDLIRKLCDSGATIGLHASYEAGLCPDKIKEEKERLEDACGFGIVHNRHHFLGWREIKDGWALAEAGLTDDSTLGFADAPGFRLGTCQPVPLLDPATMTPFGIVEHALHIMDGTLSDPKYLGLDEEAAFHRAKVIINQVKKHRGELVLLWHNSSFEVGQSYHRDLYTRILREIAEGGI